MLCTGVLHRRFEHRRNVLIETLHRVRDAPEWRQRSRRSLIIEAMYRKTRSLGVIMSFAYSEIGFC